MLGRGHQPPVGTGTPRGSEAPPELVLGPVAAPCLAAPSRSYYFRKQLWGQAAATPLAWVFLEDTEPPAAWLGALGAETPPGWVPFPCPLPEWGQSFKLWGGKTLHNLTLQPSGVYPPAAACKKPQKGSGTPVGARGRRMLNPRLGAGRAELFFF